MSSISNKKHWLFEISSRFPNKNAVQAGGKFISYDEFFKHCLSVSNYLTEKGIKKNQNVGILFSHDYDFFTLINALWFIGAIPVPLNSRNSISEITNQLKYGSIKFLIIDEKLVSDYKEIVFKNKILWNKVSGRKYDNKCYKKNTFDYKLKNLISNFSLLNTALIMFTSGSTGKPKAVVHTFKNIFESVKATNSFTKLKVNDKWLISLPLYHIGGFMVLCRALLSGSTVLFPQSLKFNELKKTIKLGNPSHLSFVPTMLKTFVDKQIKPNKNLKVAYIGGGPADDELIFSAIQKNWPIVKVYGSTETCSMVTALSSKNILNGNTSVGKPIGNNKIKIMIKSLSADKAGKIKKKNVGEIVVRSNALLKKYYNDNLTTHKKLKGNWYFTGDFGRIDGQGYLYLDSRREDLIITGGENVNTKELENALKSIPSIRDAFVFGLKDKKWGQKVCAVVVAKNISEIVIKEILKTKIASYKIPKEIYMLKNIPRNEMGKVNLKQVLKILKLNLS